MLAAFLCGSASGAGDRYVQEVWLQLERVEAALARGGYTQGYSHVVDKLAREANQDYPVTLEEGLDYAIVAVCDSDCDNVDVRVLDENGNEIAVDRSEDDLPVVTLAPIWTGEFTIEVQLSGCRTQRCTIGVGIFAHPGVIDAGRDT